MPLNLKRTLGASQDPLVPRATWMETLAERRFQRGSKGSSRFPHPAQLRVCHQQVLRCRDSRIPGGKTPAAMFSLVSTWEGRVMLCRCGDLRVHEGEPGLKKKKKEKFTFGDQFQQLSPGKTNSRGEAPFCGTVKERTRGASDSVVSPACGSRVACNQGSLQAVLGRKRWWDRG